MKKFATGPLLIMIAASLWALDPLFRSALRMQPATIVMLEHAFGFLFFAIILAPKAKDVFAKFKKLNVLDWGVLLLMTLVSSILGTLLFTEAIALGFKTFDFITPTLLQKTQPLFVVGLSILIFRDKPSLRFLLLVPIALIGSYMIDFGGEPISLTFGDKELLYILSLGAAFCWGSGTILSKHILGKLDYKEAGAARFGLAAILTPFVAYGINLISFIIRKLGFADWTYDYGFSVSEFSKLFDTSIIFPGVKFFGGNLSLYNVIIIMIIGIITGAIGIFIYYRGLRNTSAKVSTFAELTYPIIALIIGLTVLNPYGTSQPIVLAKIFGATILIISMLLISLENHEKSEDKKS